MDVLIDDGKVSRALNNLQRRGQIRSAGNTRLRAPGRRVSREAIRVVLVTLRNSPRLIRNLSIRRVNNDALTRGGPLHRGMPFDVHPCRIPRFPYSSEIRRAAVI